MIDSLVLGGGKRVRALLAYAGGELAAADPSDVLQQADVASGHFEIGTILLKAHRYPEAEEHFRRAAALQPVDVAPTAEVDPPTRATI